MTLEQLLVVAIFVLAPLINYLVRVMRQRAPAPEPEPRQPVPAPAEPPVEVRVVSWAPDAARGESRVPPPAAPRRRRPDVARPVRPRAAWLGSPRAARRGIVLMTVLGTCRGLEPSAEPREAGPPPS